VCAGAPVLFMFRRALLALFRWRTRRVYRKLARQVASEVADYLASGMDVQAVVGVDGSPSCRVSKTMDHKQVARASSSTRFGPPRRRNAASMGRPLLPGRSDSTCSLKT
jgi:hypothetical protein